MAVDPQRLRVNRNELAKFLPDPRTVREFEKLLNDFVDVAEGVIAAQAAADAAAVAAVAADAAAVAAQTAADNAQTAVDAVSLADDLRASYTTGLTITATDAGANATIAISAHTRVYGDGTSVAVDAGSITGLAYSTSYWVGYVQASRLGGAVTYTADTAVRGNATGDPNYHFVGATLTPAAAGPPIDGFPVLPPGGVIP